MNELAFNVDKSKKDLSYVGTPIVLMGAAPGETATGYRRLNADLADYSGDSTLVFIYYEYYQESATVGQVVTPKEVATMPVNIFLKKFSYFTGSSQVPLKFNNSEASVNIANEPGTLNLSTSYVGFESICGEANTGSYPFTSYGTQLLLVPARG